MWTLDRQLAWIGQVGNRDFAVKAIVEVARSFRQGWAAESALATILAHDLRDCRHIPDIAEAADRLRWFPRAIDLPSLTLRRAVTLLNEVSQNAEAATQALGGSGWQINLRKAKTNLETLESVLREASQSVTAALTPVVQSWKERVSQALEHAPQDTGPEEIENLYIFGNPIQPEEERVFVGREDLFAKIMENLSAAHRPTLVLHGQRRTGKTSLLLQLPNRLPADYVPVCIDLQQTAPVDGLKRFLYTLARETVRQADKNRRLVLPPVELQDFDYRGTHAFYEWLEQTCKALEGRLLLFALDEFEKIEEAIERGQMEMAVLDVLRHLIQHHSSWLVLLFAGVRTLEEMGHNWHSYFISVRPLHVSYLDPNAARELILLPTQMHSIQYDEQTVERILRATRAQPFLVQAVCFELVQYLNTRHRRVMGPFGRVTVKDANEAIHRAVRSATPYFQDLWRTSSSLERLVLANLAFSHTGRAKVAELGRGSDANPQVIHQAIERLTRRELIEKKEREYQFQVPMMRQWICEEISLEAVQVTCRAPSEVAEERSEE